MGIDVFSDILNHSYDFESDMYKKIDLILNDIDRIMETDLDSIWKETYQRRKQNFDLVHSLEFKNFLSQELINRLN